MYTCAEPGQAAIEAAIHEHKLDGVVVASCTPRMHEPTFRRTVERAGLNRYMFEMANIREHVSWIGKDKEANTNKAAELVRIAVEKLRRDNPLFSKSFESTKRVLVIGGGVAGIQAAMLPDGTALVAFILDRGSDDSDEPYQCYELAYRTVESDGTLGDLVVLTNDTETDTNPQAAAVSVPKLLIAAWMMMLEILYAQDCSPPGRPMRNSAAEDRGGYVWPEGAVLKGHRTS